MNNKKIYNKDKDNENYDNFENKYNDHYKMNKKILEYIYFQFWTKNEDFTKKDGNEMHKYNHKLLKTITKLKII